MEDNFKHMVGQGLLALQAGVQQAQSHMQEIGKDVGDSGLRNALQQGQQTSRQWAERLAQAVQQVGAQGSQDNPVVEALYTVSKKIRSEAKDARSRDLGIIANGQLALHYWIAAFGTMASYTKQLGLTQVAQDLKDSLDEAKRADDHHTELAKTILQQQGTAAR